MHILVIGRGKTGTTVISKTIANGAESQKYHLEPKETKFFVTKPPTRNPSTTTKILSDHWASRPRIRNAIVHNEFPFKFDKRVAITRDPRDELISRMFYLAYAWAQTPQFDERVAADWVSLLEAKEARPDAVHFADIASFIKANIGYDAWALPEIRGYMNLIKHLPAHSFTIKYEDFIAGNTSSLESYLGFKLPDNRDVGPGLRRTYRSGKADNWKTFFTASDMQRVQSDYDQILDALGYNDLEKPSGGQISTDECSGYVRRLFREAASVPLPFAR